MPLRYTLSWSYIILDMRLVLFSVAACYAGMAIFAIGMFLGFGEVADFGAWLTLPLTLLYAGPIAVLLIGLPASAVLRALEWLRRRLG